MLWAALFFPELAIDMLSGTVATGLTKEGPPLPNEALPASTAPANTLPAAVIVQQGSKRLLMSCNQSARNLGLCPGQALNSAYAVCPDLHTIDYDEEQQHEHLEHISLWALQYSSWVTPVAPDTVMLEVKASLSLFGGLQPMLEKLLQGAHLQGLQMQIGIAPTPSAARLLSRQPASIRTGCPGTDDTWAANPCNNSSLQEVLGAIAVDYLPLNDFTIKGLRQSGIKSCKQLFTLPASALTRRFGQPCTELVYKLLGKLPDPCPAFKAPERFTRSLDLVLEAPDTHALQFPLNRLLSALGGFLRLSDLGVKTLHIILLHHRLPPSRITLGFLEATANHKHLLKVASEKLMATTLPAPAIAITIDAEHLANVTRSGKDLFNKSRNQTNSIQQTLDLLTARLGPDKVYIPALQQDHRPEKAPIKSRSTQSRPVRSRPDSGPGRNSPADKGLKKASHRNTRSLDETNRAWPARPIWLLENPLPAHKPLSLRSTAERIENGWWDTDDVRRDYYLAEDAAGAWYWAYTLRKSTLRKSPEEPEKLYIHGYFA